MESSLNQLTSPEALTSNLSFDSDPSVTQDTLNQVIGRFMGDDLVLSRNPGPMSTYSVVLAKNRTEKLHGITVNFAHKIKVPIEENTIHLSNNEKLILNPGDSSFQHQAGDQTYLMKYFFSTAAERPPLSYGEDPSRTYENDYLFSAYVRIHYLREPRKPKFFGLYSKDRTLTKYDKEEYLYYLQYCRELKMKTERRPNIGYSYTCGIADNSSLYWMGDRLKDRLGVTYYIKDPELIEEALPTPLPAHAHLTKLDPEIISDLADAAIQTNLNPLNPLVLTSSLPDSPTHVPLEEILLDTEDCTIGYYNGKPLIIGGQDNNGYIVKYRYAKGEIKGLRLAEKPSLPSGFNPRPNTLQLSLDEYLSFEEGYFLHVSFVGIYPWRYRYMVTDREIGHLSLDREFTNMGTKLGIKEVHSSFTAFHISDLLHFQSVLLEEPLPKNFLDNLPAFLTELPPTISKQPFGGSLLFRELTLEYTNAYITYLLHQIHQRLNSHRNSPTNQTT